MPRHANRPCPFAFSALVLDVAVDVRARQDCVALTKMWVESESRCSRLLCEDVMGSSTTNNHTITVTHEFPVIVSSTSISKHLILQTSNTVEYHNQ